MIERTKIWIANAMKRLLAKKSLEKIRVTEICEEAQIKRPTFYYHFKDKYDLVAWYFVYSTFKSDFISVKSSAMSLNQMRKDFIFYKRAYEDTSQNALWQYMLEYFVERYTSRAKSILEKDTLDTQTRYSIRFFCYGAVGMTREWLLNDNITSAETVVTLMFNSMPEILRKIFFVNNA